MSMAACAGCGELFGGVRADAAYCSPRCRQRAYRERRGQRGSYVPLDVEAKRQREQASTAEQVRREEIKARLLADLTARNPSEARLRKTVRLAVAWLEETGS
jgi:hypothetical protein